MFPFQIDKSQLFCEIEVDPTLSQMTEHRHHGTLHCQRVKELVSLQPLLKHVGDTEVLSVPPLDLYFVKTETVEVKQGSGCSSGNTRSMYKGCCQHQILFQSRAQKKDVNVSEETQFLFLCLSCWWPNVEEVCLRLCNTKSIIYLNLGQLKLHSYVHQSYSDNRK